MYDIRINEVSVWRKTLAAVAFMFAAMNMSAQVNTTGAVSQPTRQTPHEVELKNNLIYDATLTPNLTAEVRLSQRRSLQVGFGLNPWTFHDNKKIKHLMVMPELRFWADSTFYGNFFAVNAFYSHYNVSGVDLLLWHDTKPYRYMGDAVALGVSFGHRWNFLRRDRALRQAGFYASDYYTSLAHVDQLNYWRESRWALEAEAGLDVGYAWYKKYDCGNCGAYLGRDDKPFLVPTLALNVIYRIGKMEHPLPPAEPEPLDTAEVAPPPPPFEPQLVLVKEFGGVADSLSQTNKVLVQMADYKPYDATRILRKEEGALYVHFPVDKTTLRRDFRENAPILDQIIDITRQIMADTTSDVRRIQIVGLASIEGNYPHNRDLADGRAKALQAYVQQHVSVPDSLFDTVGGAEAWTEFRDQINDVRILKTGGTIKPVGNGIYTLPSTEGITLDEVEQLLAIIDSDLQPDVKERQIKQMNRGRTYQYLKTNILSDQRNSGYIRIYWDHVPDLNAQTINQASQLLQQGNHQEALRLLHNVKDDPRAYNTLAVALYQNGDTQQALHYFRLAAQDGNTQAQDNLRQLQQRLR